MVRTGVPGREGSGSGDYTAGETLTWGEREPADAWNLGAGNSPNSERFPLPQGPFDQGARLSALQGPCEDHGAFRQWEVRGPVAIKLTVHPKPTPVSFSLFPNLQNWNDVNHPAGLLMGWDTLDSQELEFLCALIVILPSHYLLSQVQSLCLSLIHL